MTWTIEPSALLGEDNAVSGAVARFYDAFAHMLDTFKCLNGIDIVTSYFLFCNHKNLQ